MQRCWTQPVVRPVCCWLQQWNTSRPCAVLPDLYGYWGQVRGQHRCKAPMCLACWHGIRSGCLRLLSAATRLSSHMPFCPSSQVRLHCLCSCDACCQHSSSFQVLCRPAEDLQIHRQVCGSLMSSQTPPRCLPMQDIMAGVYGMAVWGIALTNAAFLASAVAFARYAHASLLLSKLRGHIINTEVLVPVLLQTEPSSPRGSQGLTASTNVVLRQSCLGLHVKPLHREPFLGPGLQRDAEPTL